MNPDFVVATELLPLPRVPGLSARRRTGEVCVWCSCQPVLDLGPRIGEVRGRIERFRPRGCLNCARREAARVYTIHSRTCRRCAPGLYCPDSVALYALAHRTEDAHE